MQLFSDHSFSSLPLVDPAGRLVGLLTRSDLYRARQEELELEQPLGPICTRRLRTIQAQEPVSRAVELMHRYGVKHLPVVDGEDRVTGMISFRDLLRELLRHDVGDAVKRD